MKRYWRNPLIVVPFVILVFVGGMYIILAALHAATSPWFVDRSIGETRGETTMFLVDEGHIRVSWGTESSVRITPMSFLTQHRSVWGLGRDTAMEKLPAVAIDSDEWFYDVSRDGSFVPAIQYVNPYLNDAIDTALDLMALSEDSASEDAAILRVGSSGYIYLGYAARTMDEAQTLFEARCAGAIENPDVDIVFDGATLYRLRKDLAERLADDPTDPDEVSGIAATIPVLVEAMNGRLGHPCWETSILYLDGHIERVVYGTKYPATQEFMSLFLYNEKP